MRIQHKRLLTNIEKLNSNRITTCPFSKNIFYSINSEGRDELQIEIIPQTKFCIRWIRITLLKDILFKKDRCESIVAEYRKIIAEKNEEGFNMFFDTPFNYTVN